MTIFHSGFELPVLDRFNSFFVQAHAEAAQDADVAGTSVGTHDQAQGTSSLVLRLAGFLREFGLRVVNDAGRSNAPAHVEDASTSAAAFARPQAWAFA